MAKKTGCPAKFMTRKNFNCIFFEKNSIDHNHPPEYINMSMDRNIMRTTNINDIFEMFENAQRKTEKKLQVKVQNFSTKQENDCQRTNHDLI